MAFDEAGIEMRTEAREQGVQGEPPTRDSSLKNPATKLVPFSLLRKLASFPVFLAVLLVAGVFLAVSLRLEDVASELPGYNHPLFLEGDTWWHIATGERILATHTWPTTNYFSFAAPNSEWIAYEWLGEIPIALAADHGGLRGMLALLVFLAAAIVLLLAYYAYLHCGNSKAACIAAAILLPLTGTCFTLRPQLFGYVFLLITLICLERFRQGSQKALWVLPVIFMLWVNTHGTFIFGLLALLIYWASGLLEFRGETIFAERWRTDQRLHLEIVSLLSVLALAVTPYGTRLIGYVLNAAFSQPINIATIEEWQPLDFTQFFGKLFLGLALFFVLAQILWRPKHRLHVLAFLLFAFYCALVHQRFIPLFAVMFAPFLATLLARWIPPYQPEKDKYVLNLVLVVIFLVGMAKLFPPEKGLDQLVTQNYPVRAVEYLRAHPVSGPMLNEHSWGGYLIRAWGPDHKVFIDGREDAYIPAGVFSDYLDIIGLKRDVRFLLRKYGIQACLIERLAPLSTMLENMPGWQKVYGDEVSNLFVRSSHD